MSEWDGCLKSKEETCDETSHGSRPRVPGADVQPGDVETSTLIGAHPSEQ